MYLGELRGSWIRFDELLEPGRHSKITLLNRIPIGIFLLQRSRQALVGTTGIFRIILAANSDPGPPKADNQPCKKP
ncbi:MAG: hypothetical protein CMJ99_01140 [Planctomycetes bacterium]|nr:hypothetical protein [Planctomycetota bacterium]